MVQKTNPHKWGFNAYLLVTFVNGIIILFFLAKSIHVPFLNLLSETIQNIYKPHPNTLFQVSVGPTPFLVYIYAVFFLSYLWSILLRRKNSESTLRMAAPLIFSAYLLVISFQLAGIFFSAQREFSIYHGKSTQEKYAAVIGGKTYVFAQYCKRNLPGSHNAEFMTDSDLSRDPGMINHRMLAYFLYPIDIRNVRNESKDSLIIFKKKDALSYVPAEYKVIGMFDSNNLIAVKR